MKTKILNMAIAIAIGTGISIGVTGSAYAGAGDSRVLKRIAERGVVNIGYRETSIPFSYIGQDENPIGYSIDICMNIVDDIRKELGNPDIKVKYTPVTGQTRIPLIANGTIDMECGSTTNNLTRQKQVAYLPTTFITGTKIAVRKGSGINKVDDLEGKIIGLAAGTTNEKAIKAYIKKKGLNIKVVEVKDHSQGWLAMETRRVDAYGSDDVLLYGLISRAKNPTGYGVVGPFLSFDPYGIMVPRNDSTFQRLGTATLARLMRTGKIHKIYKKWFEPGPTKINMPMSETLTKAFEIQALPN